MFSAAESRLGECREREKVIRLSRRHAVKGDPREVTDTILHEIAHALAEARHGLAWKAVANRLGATPKARAEESDDTRADRQAAKARFRAGMEESTSHRGSSAARSEVPRRHGGTCLEIVNRGHGPPRRDDNLFNFMESNFRLI